MNQSKEGKIIRTTLDSLPYGTMDSIESGRITNPKMPEGVTAKQLMRDVVLIAWPSLVELILTQLTTMADQMMVGRLPGEAGVMALSAVGLASQPKFLLMTMMQALNVGATAMVARFRGQQNQAKANQVVRQALIINLILSMVFMVVGIAAATPLISMMSGSAISAETLSKGAEYLRIQMYGFVPLALCFTMTAALRGIGDTRTPMIYNTIANVINLILNYVMIYGKFGFPAMGVAGASWATIIGQTVAFIIATVVMFSKKRYLYIDFKEKFSFDKKIMLNVIGIGFPNMVEQLFMRAGIMIFTRTVSGLGDTLYATHQVCMNIQALSFMMGQAFSNSITTLMGQSIGRLRYDMAELYMKQTRRLGVCASIILAIIIIIFREQIIWLYNTTPEVISWGGKILLLLAFSQPIQCSQFIVAGGLRGAGDTRYGAMVVAITVLGVRAMLGILLVNILDMGLWGAWLALLADQCLRSLLMIRRYNSGKWIDISIKRYEEKSAKARG